MAVSEKDPYIDPKRRRMRIRNDLAGTTQDPDRKKLFQIEYLPDI